MAFPSSWSHKYLFWGKRFLRKDFFSKNSYSCSGWALDPIFRPWGEDLIIILAFGIVLEILPCLAANFVVDRIALVLVETMKELWIFSICGHSKGARSILLIFPLRVNCWTFLFICSDVATDPQFSKPHKGSTSILDFYEQWRFSKLV